MDAGRWHSRGRRIVYCASVEALAVLEVRVHLGNVLPRTRYAMHEIEVSEDAVEEVSPRSLPTAWDVIPPTAASQILGDEWLRSVRSVGLRVPSVHSRTDYNVLLNPAHSSFHGVRVLARHPYWLDHRLFEAGETRRH